MAFGVRALNLQHGEHLRELAPSAAYSLLHPLWKRKLQSAAMLTDFQLPPLGCALHEGLVAGLAPAIVHASAACFACMGFDMSHSGPPAAPARCCPPQPCWQLDQESFCIDRVSSCKAGCGSYCSIARVAGGKMSSPCPRRILLQRAHSGRVGTCHQRVFPIPLTTTHLVSAILVLLSPSRYLQNYSLVCCCWPCLASVLPLHLSEVIVTVSGTPPSQTSPGRSHSQLGPRLPAKSLKSPQRCQVLR